MGFEPAVLNNQAEHNFIRQAQKGFSNDRTYWISGSTNAGINTIFDFQNSYLPGNSGEYCII